METILAKSLPPIPAIRRPSIQDVARFNGLQETPNVAPFHGRPLELWTMTETITPTLMKNGTFVRETIVNGILAAFAA